MRRVLFVVVVFFAAFAFLAVAVVMDAVGVAPGGCDFVPATYIFDVGVLATASCWDGMLGMPVVMRRRPGSGLG